MPTALTASASDNSSAARIRQRLPAWLREPLLHFLVAGALLFAVDHFAVSRSDDPHTIVMGAAVDQEARRIFVASRGHEPDAAELKALRQVWLDNEVLYREGLALQVDKGDDAIRERVIFKALSVVDASVKLPTPDVAQLREWFEARRAKYDEPARYDFDEAALEGQVTESDVSGFVEALNAGLPGDARAGLRVYKGRPLANLEQVYGDDFPAELEKSTPGTWRAFKTRDSWRAMRLNAVAPARKADFESHHELVLQDWKDAIASEQRTAAVRAMAAKYKIKIEAPAK